MNVIDVSKLKYRKNVGMVLINTKGHIFAGKRTTGGTRRAGNPHEGIWDREVPKYTQIGNAVPVGLAQKVGEHFVKNLSEV
mgnify:CR=1 FL=1